MNKIGVWVGGITAVIVLAGMVLWGVPFYIKVQVREQVNAELEGKSTPMAVVENTAAIKAFGTQLTGIDTRMIARDEWLQGYLERQADQ